MSVITERQTANSRTQAKVIFSQIPPSHPAPSFVSISTKSQILLLFVPTLKIIWEDGCEERKVKRAMRLRDLRVDSFYHLGFQFSSSSRLLFCKLSSMRNRKTQTTRKEAGREVEVPTHHQQRWFLKMIACLWWRELLLPSAQTSEEVRYKSRWTPVVFYN